MKKQEQFHTLYKHLHQNISWFDLDLQSDRTSTHTFEGKQLRLCFTAIAYILLNNLGEKCLVNTELKNAKIGTIGTKLLKLGAVITICKQRVLVLIAISCACPYKEGRFNDLWAFISTTLPWLMRWLD